ncbi:MAG: hypothetical protein M3R36_01940 [Bacteroidota bacterium]|nr:hypothetical protein [Bacteroidota bacterium]
MFTIKKITLIVTIILALTQEILAQKVIEPGSIFNPQLEDSIQNTITNLIDEPGQFVNKFDSQRNTKKNYGMVTGNKISDSVSNLLEKEKNYLSFGSGVSLVTLQSNSAYFPGINVQLSAMKVMSHSHAIRVDLQYAHNVATDKYSYNYEEGDLNTYAVNFNFLLSNFKNPSMVNTYAILGGGMNIQKQEDTKLTYPEYNYQSGTYTGRTITYSQNNEAYNYMNLHLGGGLNYQLSEKFNLYGEAQYTFPVVHLGEYTFPFIYGIFFGSPSIRAGVKVEL